MGREFEKIKFYFLNLKNKIKWFNRSSLIILRNHKFINQTLKYSTRDDDCLNIESISLTNNNVKEDKVVEQVVKISNSRFWFDESKMMLKSVNGIILIEYRDFNAYTLDYTEFNLAKKMLNLSNNHYFKLYKSGEELITIIVLDKVGNLFKFV